VYPAKELEHGLRPNSQISQYIIPTKVSTIQPGYDILYIYKSIVEIGVKTPKINQSNLTVCLLDTICKYIVYHTLAE
jgi:hypothetical protein